MAGSPLLAPDEQQSAELLAARSLPQLPPSSVRKLQCVLCGEGGDFYSETTHWNGDSAQSLKLKMMEI